jgi:hypothetical protein
VQLFEFWTDIGKSFSDFLLKPCVPIYYYYYYYWCSCRHS